MNKYSNLNENAIREAAYYIWKNNGCPANTSISDWNLAIQQLSGSCNFGTSSSCSSKTTFKTSSCRSTSLKKCSKSTTSTSKKSSTGSKKSK